MSLPSVEDALKSLPIKTILSECSKGRRLVIPKAVRTGGREALLQHVQIYGPLDLLAALQDLAAPSAASNGKRRREDAAVSKRRVAQKTDRDDERSLGEGTGGGNDEKDLSHFLELPTEDERKECYRQFYEATSNAHVFVEICSICGRESGLREAAMECLPLDSLPNSHRLVPHKPHPAHDLYNGRLLDPAGIFIQHGVEVIRACRECLKDLGKKDEAPPRYSLANNLWIGKIPWVLQRLTLPEQLLIAHLYPRVYVFKLFPKAMRGAPNLDEGSCQRAM
jgi:hypothetical protein